MALVRRMTANPVKSLVTVERHKRRRNMATQKRKGKATKRRNPVNPVNPTRRRRRSTRRRTVYARHRNPINPVRRRRRRHTHRRNPVSGGLIMTGFRLALAGAAIGMAQPFIRNFAAPWLGGGPIASAGITFGTSYLLSFATKFIPFTRRYENDILLAGATIAAAQIVSAYVLPALRIGGGANPMMGAPRYRRGMRGIGITTGIPPTIVPPPLPPPGANNGMQGLAMRNGQFGY